MTEILASFATPKIKILEHTHKARIIEVVGTRGKSLKRIYKDLKDIPQSSIRRNLHELKHAGIAEQTGNLKNRRWKIIAEVSR